MWPFKKKKMYRVKYTDDFGQVMITIVKAADLVQACREVEKRHTYRWQVHQILEIDEVKK
jgi:hypothetical protein